MDSLHHRFEYSAAQRHGPAPSVPPSILARSIVCFGTPPSAAARRRGGDLPEGEGRPPAPPDLRERVARDEGPPPPLPPPRVCVCVRVGGGVRVELRGSGIGLGCMGGDHHMTILAAPLPDSNALPPWCLFAPMCPFLRLHNPTGTTRKSVMRRGLRFPSAGPCVPDPFEILF